MTEAPNNGALYKKNSEVTVSQAAAFPLTLSFAPRMPNNEGNEGVDRRDLLLDKRERSS